MPRKSLWTLLILLLILVSPVLHAQARLAVYGTFGGEKSGIANQGWTTAGTFGLYVGITKFGPLYLSADARADLSSNINSGLIGPRLAVRIPVFPIKPYAELLIGAASYSRTAAGLKDANQFTSRYVLGADTTILPHIDWRIADFSYAIDTSANAAHAKTLSTGLVLRF